MERRFDRADLHLIGLCVLVTLMSLGLGTHLFYRAFPEASIDFKVSRAESRLDGEAFLRGQNLANKNYRHSAIFSFDSTAKTFLERELGLEGATQTINDPVRLWRWEHRWVRPHQKEEYRVSYTTDGNLVAFDHLLEEEYPGANLSPSQARDLAQKLIIGFLNIDLAAYEFIEAEKIQRPQRTDHLFTWQLRDWEVSGANYRLYLRLHGDRLGGFDHVLKVPETWQREYQDLRSYNQAAGLVATLFMVATWVALVATLATDLRRRQVRWRGACILGGIAAVLTLLNQLNQLPVVFHSFDTNDTFAGFVVLKLVGSVFMSLAAGLGIALLAAGTEPVYRRAYPDQISLFSLFSRRGFQTRRFVLHICIGLALTAFFFAYQTVFYLVADHLGAWSPADIPYRELVNTRFPWITVLLIGFMPAVSEEFTSRAFSIPFITRLVRWRWLAVVLAAFIWGFAHAGYPQQPFYIRGLEVGLAGILIGAVMLRWGLLPVLVWHYTIDALYTALILLRSGDLYFQLTAGLAAGLALLPLFVALYLYFKRQHFADPTPILNGSTDNESSDQENISTSPPEHPEVATNITVDFPQQKSLRPEAHILEPRTQGTWGLQQRRLVLGFVVLCLASSVLLLERQQALQPVSVSITQSQATAIAIKHLSGQQLTIDTANFKQVTTWQHQAPPDVLAYLAENGGIPQINHTYKADLRSSMWRVRFYRPHEKEEIHVWIDASDGRIYSQTHLFDEKEAGADLEEELAQQHAAAYMQSYGIDPTAFTVVESSSEKLPARRDHRIVWQALPQDQRHVGKALYRIEVRLAGEQLAGIRRYFKLPETWQQQRANSPTWQAILRGMGLLLIATTGLHLLWLLLRATRAGQVSWGLPRRLGLGAAALFGLGLLNQLDQFYGSYPTQMSSHVFLIIQAVTLLLGAASVGLGLSLVLAWISAHFGDDFKAWWECRLTTTEAGSLAAAGLTVWALYLFSHLKSWLHFRFAGHLNTIPVSDIPSLDSYIPALSGLISALMDAVSLLVTFAVAAFYANHILRRRVVCLAVLIAICALIAGAQAHSLAQFTLAFLVLLSTTAVYILVAIYFLRREPRAYLLAGFLFTALPVASQWLGLEARVYQIQGMILVAFCVLIPGLALIFDHLRFKAKS